MSNTPSQQKITLHLVVSLGGALGACSRYGVAELVARWWGGAFPLGTLAINLTGSFMLAAFLTLIGGDTRWTMARFFFATGFLGAYTTFSTFSLETAELLRGDDWLIAGGSIAASLLGGIAAATAGYWLAARWRHR